MRISAASVSSCEWNFRSHFTYNFDVRNQTKSDFQKYSQFYIFRPSTSIDENLPIEYMRAEKLGQQSDCQKYIDRCGVSLLDTISTFTHVN